MERNYLYLQASKKLFTIQFYTDLLQAESRDIVEDWFDQNNPVCYPSLITHLIGAVDLKLLIIFNQNRNNVKAKSKG